MLKTVLIVEDYDDSRSFMKLLVEMLGYKVTEATSGIEAVLSVKNKVPNLILMDIGLPDMDGFVATKIIRDYLTGIKVPIVAVTALGKNYYGKAIQAGCNDLIGKPVNIDSLTPVIKQYLEN